LCPSPFGLNDAGAASTVTAGAVLSTVGVTAAVAPLAGNSTHLVVAGEAAAITTRPLTDAPSTGAVIERGAAADAAGATSRVAKAAHATIALVRACGRNTSNPGTERGLQPAEVHSPKDQVRLPERSGTAHPGEHVNLQRESLVSRAATSGRTLRGFESRRLYFPHKSRVIS
jgi:hypothetical protein